MGYTEWGGYNPKEGETKTDVYQIGDNTTAFGLIMAKEGGVASMDEILEYIKSISYIERDFTAEYIQELQKKMRGTPDFGKLFEEVDGGYRFIGDKKGRENMISRAKEFLDKKK